MVGEGDRGHLEPRRLLDERGIRQAPSRIEYSEWTWRWTNGGSRAPWPGTRRRLRREHSREGHRTGPGGQTSCCLLSTSEPPNLRRRAVGRYLVRGDAPRRGCRYHPHGAQRDGARRPSRPRARARARARARPGRLVPPRARRRRGTRASPPTWAPSSVRTGSCSASPAALTCATSGAASPTPSGRSTPPRDLSGGVRSQARATASRRRPRPAHSRFGAVLSWHDHLPRCGPHHDRGRPPDRRPSPVCVGRREDGARGARPARAGSPLFLDLTQDGELEPYAHLVPPPARTCGSRSGTSRSRAQAGSRSALDEIDGSSPLAASSTCTAGPAAGARGSSSAAGSCGTG